MRYLIYKKATLVSIALLIALTATAITSDYSVTHYTNENGLPQNSIRGAELDKNGFLWVATEAGLVRFDGQRFQLYDREHYPVLQSSRITEIEQDDDGTLIFSDEFGNHYDFNRQGILQYLPLSDYKQRNSQPRYDSFWIRGDLAIYRPQNYRPQKWTIWVPGLRYETVPGRWGTLNSKLYFRDKQSTLWSIDTNRNITRAKVIGLLSDKGSLGASKVNGLYLQGKTLYLHVGKGIYCLSEGSNKELKATLVLETEVQNIGFYRNYPELNLQVIGTHTDGVYLFHRKQFATLKHSNGFGNYYPQVPLGDSGVLTDRGPVYPLSSRFDYPFRNIIRFRSLLLDSRGSYWINEGLYGNYNIMQVDRQLQIIKRFPSNGTANCFRETPDGCIWLCSYIGRALGYVDQDSVRWLPFQWRAPQSILTFLPIDNETFWIGGVRILAKLNVKTGQQIHYKNLEKFTIESLYLDSSKVLWIGTTGNGFFALKQNRIFKLPLDTRAGLKHVHSFIEDKNGFMWMSTNNGLFRCKKEDLNNFIEHKASTVYYQCFSKESGFNTNEFNGSCTPSAIVLGNGKFSFPSLDGLVQFYPDSIKEALPVSKIFVDKLLIDGKQNC
jgi:hypothetical protein